MSEILWHYFLSLEKDFIETINFAELSKENSETFSDQYAKIILLVGSEVDICCKILCHQIDSNKKANNIVEYYNIIKGKFPKFHEICIDIPRFSLEIYPWREWGNCKYTPATWWTAYTDIKHDRIGKRKKANQINSLTALCGLLALHLYLNGNNNHQQPFPELLDYGFPAFRVTEGGKSLPDV